MPDHDVLAQHFEEQRPRLRAVAYRMLGSLSEADDAVQETWLRLSRDDRDDVENLAGWLTTVVSRVCLNMLQTRRRRREDELELEVHVPDPVVSVPGEADPEREALLADAVGLALLVVLEQLSPPERLAFVLHDMFAVPFDDIAPIVERSPEATRQLASRARRRVQGAPPAPDTDLARQRRVVDAFMAAAREGDFEGLVAVLDPEVVLRADAGPDSPLTRLVHGAENVARGAISFSRARREGRHAIVNGAAGMVGFEDGELVSVVGLTIVGDRIVAMDILADPARLRELDIHPDLAPPRSPRGGASRETTD